MSTKSLEKRNLILECAKQVFSKKGFSIVTMKDIIEACNISRGGIYLYFNSVDEIFTEVIKLHHQSCVQKIKYDLKDTNDFFLAVNDYFEDVKKNILNIKESLKLAMIEFFVAHKEDSESRKFFKEAMDGLRFPIVEIISFGKEHNILSYSPPEELADLVIFWLIGFEEIMLSTDIPEEILDYQLELMKNLILTGKIE